MRLTAAEGRGSRRAAAGEQASCSGEKKKKDGLR